MTKLRRVIDQRNQENPGEPSDPPASPAVPSTAVPPTKPVEPKASLNPQQLATIRARLVEKGVTGPCPRCGQLNFALVSDGILKTPVQDLSNNVILGGTTIPSIAAVCTQCGFLSIHALGMLGFLKGGKVEI